MPEVPASARTPPHDTRSGRYRLLAGGRVVTPAGVLSPGWIRLAGNVIEAVGPTTELPDSADPAPGPALLAERKDDAQRLRRAIDELPEKYRTVITLYHLQGKQYEEIATVLNLPLGTVKTHLFRAKELLRKALTT